MKNPEVEQATLSPATLRERLADSSGVVMFSDFRSHLDRDAVFVVASSLHLVECAVSIALDQVSIVQDWIDRGLLRKPSRKERDSWPNETQRRWRAVVVQPYVLIQDC